MTDFYGLVRLSAGEKIIKFEEFRAKAEARKITELHSFERGAKLMEVSNFDLRSIKLENLASKSPVVKSKVHLTKIGNKGEVEMIEGFNHTNHGLSF